MNSFLLSLLYFSLYFIIELFYFRIARKYKIIDIPNTRSSHYTSTIRGGGVIFPIAFLIPAISYYIESNDGLYELIALFAISIISFWDDIKSLKSNVRLLVHTLAVILLLLGTTEHPTILLSFFLLILFLSIVNVYNFMDGINGITAMYSFVTFVTFFWINKSVIQISPDIFFVSILASLLVFSIFNCRHKAICFAGDVGSVAIAFTISFFLLKLITHTGSFDWILLLGVYGVDAGFTVGCRILRKESIFRPHRSHFYQFLANEAKMSHVSISAIYACLQFVLNVVLLFSYERGITVVAWATLFVILLIYTIFRLKLEGMQRLFISYNPER